MQTDIVETASTELATLRTLTPAVVFRPDGVRTILDQIKAEVAATEIDISTPAGRKACASLAYKVARSKTALDGMGKQLTDQWRKLAEAVHAERRIIVAELDALAEDVRRPLTEWENVEKTRVAAHEAAIAEIEGWATVPDGWTSEQIAARIAELSQHPYRDREWQEFKARAQKAATAAFNALKVARADAAERETEAERQAKQRAEEEERQRQEAERLQAEREERIAAEAADRAKAEAERIAREEAAEVERRVEAERQAAAQREREAAEALATAEKDRIAAEERSATLEAARVARHKAAIADILENAAWGTAESSAEIELRLNYLTQIPVTKFDEFADEAAAVIQAEIERARGFLTSATQREAEQAEAARVSAEQLAERQREADRIAAQGREDRARQEATEAERRRQDAERQQQQAKADRRAANVAHRRSVNRDAVADLVQIGLTEEAGVTVVTAIAKGEVRRVAISY